MANPTSITVVFSLTVWSGPTLTTGGWLTDGTTLLFVSFEDYGEILLLLLACKFGIASAVW